MKYWDAAFNQFCMLPSRFTRESLIDQDRKFLGAVGELEFYENDPRFGMPFIVHGNMVGIANRDTVPTLEEVESRFPILGMKEEIEY